MGMLGMHGTYWANMAMCEADLIFAVGARFDDRVTGRLDAFAENADTIIHIDIDPSNIGKNVRTDIPIVGDVKTVLRSLIDALRTIKKDWATDHMPWLEMIRGWAKAAGKPKGYKAGESFRIVRFEGEPEPPESKPRRRGAQRTARTSTRARRAPERGARKRTPSRRRRAR